MNDLINDLYQEIILDHGREPRNFGECEPHNKSADGHNPLCGDNLKLTFFLNDQNIIEDIKKACKGDRPVSIAITPYIIPNGKTPSCNGNSSKTPCLKIFHFIILCIFNF